MCVCDVLSSWSMAWPRVAFRFDVFPQVVDAVATPLMMLKSVCLHGRDIGMVFDAPLMCGGQICSALNAIVGVVYVCTAKNVVVVAAGQVSVGAHTHLPPLYMPIVDSAHFHSITNIFLCLMEAILWSFFKCDTLWPVRCSTQHPAPKSSLAGVGKAFQQS